MEQELLELMPDTVQIAPWTGTTGAGYAKPTYGADVPSRARISLKDEWVRSHDGREIAIRGKVFIPPPTSIPSVKDRLTLPAGYVPTKPPILDVQPQRDEVGLHHVVLIIG